MSSLNPVNHKFLNAFLMFLISITPALVFANQEKNQITKLLTQSEAPDGVVFELIGSEKTDYLPKALKKVEKYKKQLQEKFPKLDIAIVSHGAEQFKLSSKNKDKEMVSHKSVQRLVAADVPVHICETHASWRGVTPEDFPDYITPSSQGPEQIRQYQEIGYILVVVQ